MAIDFKGIPGPISGVGESSHATADRTPSISPQRETGRPAVSDTVHLTDAASELHKLESAIKKLPVVDTQRVEAIRQALADGLYEVNPGRTAEKLTAFESALSG